MFNAVISAPFGHVGIRTGAGKIVEIVYLTPGFVEQAPDNTLAERTVAQIERYLADPDHRFDLPLAETGTPFQQRVWQAIAAVPRGQVTTYGALARLIGSAPRAVGQACGANWFPLVIPCHRVVSAGDGRKFALGGFANHADDGFHLNVKRWLLRHEDADPVLYAL